MNADRVTVIIPNWNGRHLLGECLDALRSQTAGAPRVIVVDNGSSDGSSQFVREQFPFVDLIELERNVGFSRAVNRGIESAGTEVVSLLNNDAVPDSGWLEAMLRALAENPDVSSFASRIVFYDEPGTLDSAGDEYTPWGMVFNRGHGEPDGEEFSRPCRVFGPCAAASVYRKSMFDDIGLLDETFFAYYEDTDLNLRAALAGHECEYVPDARVRHRYSASSVGKRSKLGREEVYIHLTGVLIKNMPVPVLLRQLIPVAVVHSAILFFWLLARIRNENRLPRVPFFRFMGSMLRGRRAGAAIRRITSGRLNELFVHRSFLSFMLKK